MSTSATPSYGSIHNFSALKSELPWKTFFPKDVHHRAIILSDIIVVVAVVPANGDMDVDSWQGAESTLKDSEAITYAEYVSLERWFAFDCDGNWGKYLVWTSEILDSGSFRKSLKIASYLMRSLCSSVKSPRFYQDDSCRSIPNQPLLQALCAINRIQRKAVGWEFQEFEFEPDDLFYLIRLRDVAFYECRFGGKFESVIEAMRSHTAPGWIHKLSVHGMQNKFAGFDNFTNIFIARQSNLRSISFTCFEGSANNWKTLIQAVTKCPKLVSFSIRIHDNADVSELEQYEGLRLLLSSGGRLENIEMLTFSTQDTAMTCQEKCNATSELHTLLDKYLSLKTLRLYNRWIDRNQYREKITPILQRRNELQWQCDKLVASLTTKTEMHVDGALLAKPPPLLLIVLNESEGHISSLRCF